MNKRPKLLFKPVISVLIGAAIVFILLALNVPGIAGSEMIDGLTVSAAQRDGLKPVRVGEIESGNLELSYMDQAERVGRFQFSGASYIKIHFVDLDLMPGDTVTVSDPLGAQVHTYPGSGYTTDGGDGFWALSILGDTAIIELHSAGGGDNASSTDDLGIYQRALSGAPADELGAYVDQYARGYPEEQIQSLIEGTESTCGTNERTDAVCYQNSHPTEFDKSHSVARLIIGGTSACTGWRVSSQNRLFTNEHCITNQSDVDNTEIQFNFQRPVCASGDPYSPTIVTGDTLLADNYDYDFALITLDNFPNITSFGYLEVDPRTPALDEEIYIPQHGEGNPKEFGIESDMNTGNVCRIDDAVTNGRVANSDTGYFCDTIGGSSGSPVLARSNNKVIGLHHFGIGGSDCTESDMNQGVRMDQIWPLVEQYFDTTPPADKTWNGSTSSNWHTAGNWTPSGVPTSGDTVLIPDTSNDPVVSSGSAAVEELTVQPDAILDLTTRTLTSEGAVTNAGTIKQTRQVSTGGTTEFLRIKNQAGTQTKYYGVDISPTSLGESVVNRSSPASSGASEMSFLQRAVFVVNDWIAGLFNSDRDVQGTETVSQDSGPEIVQPSGFSDRPAWPLPVRMEGEAGSSQDIQDQPQVTLTPVPAQNSRSVELKIDSLPASGLDAGSTTAPGAPEADVSLVLDDGDLESAFGVNSDTNAYQFIWLNRFTPSPSDYPFTLDEIRIMFSDNGDTWNVDVGDAIDLVLYEDSDGDPTNGATWRATVNETIQSVGGTTWSVYSLSSPVTFNGPGDVLIGVIDRFVESGVTDKTYPATFDTTSGQERSWIGWWSGDPPNPPTLPPDDTFDLMTGDNAGNWLVRGYGETTSTEGINGTVTYNGAAAANINLILRYYNGSSWSIWGSPVTTDSNGDYTFTGVPSLGSGEVYYVLYDNGDNDNLDVTDYLAAWWSYQIPSYTAGASAAGGDFDIANFTHVSPGSSATVTLPQTFTWTRRSTTTDDSYTFNLFDFDDGDPAFESPKLGYADSYNLTSLPAGFDYDTEYAWYMAVYAPDDGFGISYWARFVTITDGGGPTATATATATPTLTPEPGDTDVTVSVSGDQFCSGLNMGVGRCYDIDPNTSMDATVRFYFTESERRGMNKDNLLLYHYSSQWDEEPGPYANGGSGDGQYVQVQNVDDYSLFALDQEFGGPYLPLTMAYAGAPPVPNLNEISNPDGDGEYTVVWNAVSGASSYVLEEDDNGSFSSPTTVYDGAASSKSITGRKIATYYYRVKSVNDFKSSGWSQVKSVNVTIEPPLTCEQHDFGVSGTQYYVYSSGRTWNFTAQNTMTLESVETSSRLATTRGLTFTIRVKINDSTIASWSQYVNNTTYASYYHDADLTYTLNAGDKVTYFISAPAGSGEAAIAWYNYVKLCGR